MGFLHIVSPGGCNLPTIIHIHGGGWFEGAATDMDPYQGAENGIGIIYVSIDYPLAPYANMSTMLASVQLSLNFLRQNHLFLGVDPDRLGLIGESAGGQLALQAGINDGDVRFVGSLFGPPDMRAEWQNFCVRFGGTQPGQQLCIAIQLIMGGTPDQAPGNYNAWSPAISRGGLAGHQQAPYFYFGESIGDYLVPIATVDSFTSDLAAHGLSILDDRIQGDPSVIGHNLNVDQLNFLRARCVLDAFNAMRAPALPPPTFAPSGPAQPPPPSCTCSCSGQVGIVTVSQNATASSCPAAQASAVSYIQNTLFADILAVGPPWTELYTEAAGIPVGCQCH